MFGEISFDKAADQMFKLLEKGEPGVDHELAKGMALLYRHEADKTQGMLEDEIML
jgi:hypothetical protein